VRAGDERPYAVESQHRDALLLERAEVTAGSLDPQQLDRFAGDGIGLGALRRGVAPNISGNESARATSALAQSRTSIMPL